MERCTSSKTSKYKIQILYEEQNRFNKLGPLNTSFCLVLIENGNGIVKINGDNIVFIAPVIFCINENDIILINSNSNSDIKAKIIYFHPSVLNQVFNFKNVRGGSSDFSITEMQDQFLLRTFVEKRDKTHGMFNLEPLICKRLIYLCEQLIKVSAIQKDDSWPCRTRSYLMELLFLIANIEFELKEKEHKIISEDEEKISPVLLFLMNNYDKKITISELTKQFNINRTTLSDSFNKVVGESIITYINRMRINMASTILRDTKLPISEIMLRVGFTENTHFFRTFKKYMGMSPRDYRDRYCIL